MIERREFIIKVGSILIALPVAAELVGCGESGGYTTDDAGTQTGTLRFTSSVDAGHTHTVDVRSSILLAPPMEGYSATTSNVGHTHKLELTMDDLRAIYDGGVVTKQTTTDEGHLHTFTLAMASAASV